MFKIKRKISLFCLTCMVLSLSACTQKEIEIEKEEFYTQEVTEYKTSTVELGDYILEKTSNASVEYLYQEDLHYEGSCFLKEFLVSVNSVVEKGDEIASFYTENSQIPLEEKKRELERAVNELSTKKETYKLQNEERLHILSKLENGSYDYKIQQLNIEKADIAYEQSIYTGEQRVETLREELAEIEDTFELHYLYAPFSGKVLGLGKLENDDAVYGNTVIASLVDTSKLLLRVESSDGFRYNEDVTISITTKDKNVQYDGYVISKADILSQELSSSSSYVMLKDKSQIEELSKILIENSGRMTTRIELITNKEYLSNVLLVEKDAIQIESGSKYVNILEDGVVKKRFIITSYENDDYYVVIDGLSQGQTVLIE